MLPVSIEAYALALIHSHLIALIGADFQSWNDNFVSDTAVCSGAVSFLYLSPFFLTALRNVYISFANFGSKQIFDF